MSVLSKAIKFVHWASAGAATKAAINIAIKEYGKVLDIEINKEQQSLAISVALKGENEPIKLKVDKYQIKKRDGKVFFTIVEARCDGKAWLDAALKNFARDQTFEVPNDKVDFLADFLV